MAEANTYIENGQYVAELFSVSVELQEAMGF